MASAVVLSGQPASYTFVRSGLATIPAGAKVIVVADLDITASSVIVCSGSGAVDATAFVFSVSALNVGASFTIESQANATADKVVSWAILRY
jgi:hypothetical protein